VEFACDEVIPGQNFLQTCQFSPWVSFHRHTTLTRSTYDGRYIILAISSVIK
jgi:hypothetical protein